MPLKAPSRDLPRYRRFMNDNVLYHSQLALAGQLKILGLLFEVEAHRASEAKTFVNTCRLGTNQPSRSLWRFGAKRETLQAA